MQEHKLDARAFVDLLELTEARNSPGAHEQHACAELVRCKKRGCPSRDRFVALALRGGSRQEHGLNGLVQPLVERDEAGSNT